MLQVWENCPHRREQLASHLVDALSSTHGKPIGYFIFCALRNNLYEDGGLNNEFFQLKVLSLLSLHIKYLLSLKGSERYLANQLCDYPRITRTFLQDHLDSAPLPLECLTSFYKLNFNKDLELLKLDTVEIEITKTQSFLVKFDNPTLVFGISLSFSQSNGAAVILGSDFPLVLIFGGTFLNQLSKISVNLPTNQDEFICFPQPQIVNYLKIFIVPDSRTVLLVKCSVKAFGLENIHNEQSFENQISKISSNLVNLNQQIQHSQQLSIDLKVIFQFFNFYFVSLINSFFFSFLFFFFFC
jgi:hypothetical protein